MRRFALATTALIALTSQAAAADLPSLKEAPVPPPAPSGWRFEATINGWAPSLISNVGVARFPTASADVGFFQLLSHLNGVVPLSVTARNDNFIAGLDLFWVRVSAAANFRRTAPQEGFGGVNADLHLGETILTGFGGVRLPVQASNLSLYGIVGARYFSLDTTLDLSTAVPGFGLSANQSKEWVDPIVGLNGKYQINDKWFLTGEADIGGYSSDSVTWQTFAAVGYNWTQSISTTLGFRALYVDYRQANNFDGSFRFQETLLGPQVTITYAY